ncbi:MAG: Ig-like domain-containing protein [Polyangiaceae bacterium]
MTTTELRDKWWAFAFLALSSCGSSASEVNGNLGNGKFSYVCVNDDDPACASASSTSGSAGMTAPIFPSVIASGAHFKLTYDATQSAEGGNPILKPVAPEYISALSADGSLVALKPGKCALVARSSVSGLVYDFTEITISPISSFTVTDTSGTVPTSIQLPIDGSKRLIAAALGPRNEQLAGGIDYTWTSSDPTIASVDPSNTTVVDLTGNKVGSATLTVTEGVVGQGGMSVSIPVTVTP